MITHERQHLEYTLGKDTQEEVGQERVCVGGGESNDSMSPPKGRKRKGAANKTKTRVVKARRESNPDLARVARTPN